MSWRDELAETSYEGIAFPSLDVGTQGGHDSARHQGYRVPGASIETTGRKPYEVKLKIALYSDLRGWPSMLPTETYRALIRAFEDHPDGLLVHPTRGQMPVHVDSWSESVEGRTPTGLTLDVTMSEQRGESSVLESFAAARESDPASAMESAAADVDTEAAKLGLDPIGEDVTGALEFLESAQRTWAEATATYDALTTLLDSASEDPEAALATGHAFRVAVAALRAAVQRHREDYLGTAGPRRVTVPATMSVAAIAALPEVYGDPSKASLLMGANAIPDPLFVPAGTVLLVIDP